MPAEVLSVAQASLGAKLVLPTLGLVTGTDLGAVSDALVYQ